MLLHLQYNGRKNKALKCGAFVVEPQHLYHSRLAIKKAKYNDLVNLSESHLPPECRSFYSNSNHREETNPESAFKLQYCLYSPFFSHCSGLMPFFNFSPI